MEVVIAPFRVLNPYQWTCLNLKLLYIREVLIKDTCLNGLILIKYCLKPVLSTLVILYHCSFQCNTFVVVLIVLCFDFDVCVVCTLCTLPYCTFQYYNI